MPNLPKYKTQKRKFTQSKCKTIKPELTNTLTKKLPEQNSFLQIDHVVLKSSDISIRIGHLDKKVFFQLTFKH